MLRKVIFALTASAIVLSATTACKTVRGAGEDVESAANAGSRATH